MSQFRLFSGPAGTLAKVALFGGATLFVAQTSLYNVPPGHRAVIFDRFSGVKPDVTAEGTHFMIPIIQKPFVIEVRTTPRTIQTTTGTKDLQNVQLALRVLSRPVPEKLSAIFRELGTDYNERILPSIGNEVLKAVVAQYNADQLLTLRDEVSKKIKDDLIERAKPYNLIVDDVSIIHLAFSKDFSKAIEDKQVAEQMAERAKFVVMKAEQERQALIIRSEGDAEAAKLVSDALSKHGKGLIELRRIETAQQIAETLSQSRGGVTYLPSGGNNGSNILLNLPAAGASPQQPR